MHKDFNCQCYDFTFEESCFLSPTPVTYYSSFVLSPYFSRKGGTQFPMIVQEQ